MSVIAAMGLAPGTMSFVVQKRTEGQADQVAGFVRTASCVGFASSVVVVLVGWAPAGPIVARIIHQPEQVG
ncbi:hypothetical protein MYX64_13720, partial [Nitrospinae bacterium AH_259_B05_G02_I21]|nr:hypothetical protein [Nitrospinae bacterium AH_259_B05_G02_I21]